MMGANVSNGLVSGQGGLDLALGNKYPGNDAPVQQGNIPTMSSFSGGNRSLWAPAADTAAPVGPNTYIFSNTADITTIVCTDALDTGQTILIEGVDANYEFVAQFATSNGQTEVVLSTPLLAVWVVRNVSAVDMVGFLYVFAGGGSTSGEPDDTDTVRAVINNGQNQSRMAAFTCQDTSEASTLLLGFNLGLAGGSGNTREIIAEIVTSVPGVVFQFGIPLVVSANSGPIFYNLPKPLLLTSRLRIDMRVIDNAANGTGATGGFIFQTIPAKFVLNS